MRRVVNVLLLISISSLAFAQNPGQIGLDQDICYQSAPMALTFTIQPSGGSVPYSYRWQRSNDGTTWKDITGATAARENYSPPVLGRTTWFRCQVRDFNNLVLGTTNIVTINVNADLSAGKIEGNQTVYASIIPSQLHQLTAPSGGGEDYSYQWQSSENGSQWSNITGATSVEYVPSALAKDTWFRRLLIDNRCGSTVSNSIKISVNQITLHTLEQPLNWYDNSPYNMGTEFEVLRDGFITKARLFTHESQSGNHIVRLWMKDIYGNYIPATDQFIWNITAGFEGWQEFEFPTAIPVQSGNDYIISITNGPDNWYGQSANGFTPLVSNEYILYLRGLFRDGDINLVPDQGSPVVSYFRDVVFNLFSPGSLSSSQSICYGATPSPITQLSAPTGGSGTYIFQWQSSADTITWENIVDATSQDYSPQALLTSTYFRRIVTSENISVASSPILITVNPRFTLAQLHDNITIYNNTSTNFKDSIFGGTPPYSINYELHDLNGVTPYYITGYQSGSDISTGVLTSGDYTFTNTSVIDSKGCPAESLGTSINVTVSGTYSPGITNKALVIVNETSLGYSGYLDYIKPYLDNFGIPYDVFNSSSPTGHPVFNNYAVVIFGHKNVYTGIAPNEYPIADLNAALDLGVGLYSFDPNLFNFSSGIFSSPVSPTTVSTNKINIVNTSHFITRLHAYDSFNVPINEAGDLYSNNYGVITLIRDTLAFQNSSLLGGTDLATMSDGTNLVSLLEVYEYGARRIVKWNSYNWAILRILGPLYGMDDLIWRGIVWASRKPFVMQGLPPMVTMRVDDVYGTGNGVNVITNFEWINICNEFGLIPWCGTFQTILPNNLILFKTILDNNKATAAPHAFSEYSSIYFNHDYGDFNPDFDPVLNTQIAQAYYADNGLKMSNYVVPHYYEIDPAAVTAIQNMGIEFIGTHMPFGSTYGSTWLSCGPYRLNPNFTRSSSIALPAYYGDYYPGNSNLFNCITEIRDDDGYEWAPAGYDLDNSIAQGARQLTRAISSMVLPTLFSHEYHFDMGSDDFRTIMAGITSAISKYNPEYTSMDYAVKYIRERNKIEINEVSINNDLVNITYAGTNDLDTRCYLFTEGTNGQITYRLVLLPKINGSAIVGISK